MIEIGVFLRPHLFEMLEALEPHFNICVFTASEKVYANAIIDEFDPKGKFFKKRIYRSKCFKTELGERPIFIKDLRAIVGFPIEKITIVDNSLISFALQPENGIPISSYFYDPNDIELKCVSSYLVGKVA